ncbi:MAG: DUF2793 domain-containing protein [Roseovarius sp.]
MSDITPSLSLPLLQPAQAQKHVTHNEALQLLDMVTQLTFTTFEQADPPTSPAAGEVHVVGSPATGAWAGQDGRIARFDGAGWHFTDPREGFIGYRKDLQRLVIHNGTAWTASLTDRIQDAARLGLNATADAVNPFTAQLNSALWTALETGDGGNGGVIQTMNREGPAHDVGLVLQEAYVTRAILGLFGNDALRLSVSADGAQFVDGLVIDNGTGIVSQPNLPRFAGTTNFDNPVTEHVWTTVAINTLAYNEQGCFDAATGRFTAPVDGTYLFGGNVIYIEGPAVSRSRVQLLVNGTTTMPGSFYENSGPHVSNATGTPVNGFAALTAGDTVELQYYLRGDDGFCAANDTAFWGVKVG